MDLHYYDKSAIPGLQEPDIGKIYAAQVSSDWHRVKVIRSLWGCMRHIFIIQMS
jgi:hypothetical protein